MSPATISDARKVTRFFADSPDTLEHVLDSLFYIATADGMVHEAELDYLKNVSAFRLRRCAFRADGQPACAA